MAGKSGGRRKQGRNKEYCDMYLRLGKREENARKRRVQVVKRLIGKMRRMAKRGMETSRIELHVKNLNGKFNLGLL